MSKISFDELTYDDKLGTDVHIPSEQNLQAHDENADEQREQYRDDRNDTLIGVFKKNIRLLHPVLSFVNISNVSPAIMNLAFFIFNILNYFAFNAVYMGENRYIEKRIYYSDRDKFVYPMKREAGKIFASLFTSMLCCIIVKLISLVTKGQRDKLESDLRETTDKNGRQVVMNDFSSKMMLRRMISLAIILILEVFFWLYCTVFCSMYVNTQYGWFYSGIWTIIFAWFGFAPLFIFALSFIEFNNKHSMATIIYYIKHLFWL